ncbi:hypothetical protein KVH27_35120 [Streptomyces olivaceus]|uniref:hypothetical protein n=1 Tax=Streptomyces olivaceus TaxID=47716 RepID=UPI001CCEDF56|nr:hypothetical protein [Streptomyces olivaceus]MBZ6253584.1 hypothetical protein [Streptomyces olivaceus]
MSDTTAAEAARRSANWAQRAENCHKSAGERRRKAAEMQAQRYSAGARDWEERADDAARERGTCVEMANMWANVAGALQLAELGEHS